MLILSVLAGRWKSYRWINQRSGRKWIQIKDDGTCVTYVLVMLISLFVVVMETSPKVGNEAK